MRFGNQSESKNGSDNNNKQPYLQQPIDDISNVVGRETTETKV